MTATTFSPSISYNFTPMAYLILFTILTFTFNKVSASDPDPLQDICVADYGSSVTVNGYACKSNYAYTPDDFASMAIAEPGEANIFGTKVGRANVDNMPGLNTLGMSWSRVDFEPDGLNPPHSHPRATEIIFVLEGEVRAGFITTDNVFVNKLITKGEVFVFPRGLIHFQFNVSKNKASIIVAFDSQKPGVQPLVSMFATKPNIPDDVVAKAFQTSVDVVQKIRARLVPTTTNVTVEYTTHAII